MIRTTMTIALLLAALGLQAEGPNQPAFAGVALIKGTSAFSGDTSGANGFELNGGYTFWTGAKGTGYRLTLGIGQAKDDLQVDKVDPTQLASPLYTRSTKMTRVRVAGDLVLNTPVEALKATVGLSLNRWKVAVDQPTGGTYNHQVPGVKLGAQVGLEYLVNRNLTVNLSYQVAELGTSSELKDPSSANWSPDKGRLFLMPSYFQVGASWHF